MKRNKKDQIRLNKLMDEYRLFINKYGEEILDLIGNMSLKICKDGKFTKENILNIFFMEVAFNVFFIEMKKSGTITADAREIAELYIEFRDNMDKYKQQVH